MTKEELFKEINDSLQQFVGEKNNPTTVNDIERVLKQQILNLTDRRVLNLSPVPKVTINGTEVIINLLHPVTGALLTAEDLVNWYVGF